MDNQNPETPAEPVINQSAVEQSIPSQAPPTQTPLAQLPKKPFFFSRLFIFIVVLILLIVGSTGTYFFLNSKSKHYLGLEPLPIPTQTANPSPTDETTNWKTYVNIQNGFSFKYPNDPNWLVEEKEDVVTVTKFVTNQHKDDVNNFKIGITVGKDMAANDLRKDGIGKSSKSLKDIKVDNQDGFYYETFLIDKTNTLAISTFDSPKGGVILFVGGPKLEENKEIYNKILSTFKFTVSQDETANWKTYTNNKYGFEIKYPKFGQIISNGTLSKDQRECGNAIKETTKIKEGTFPLELKEPYPLEQVEIDNLHLINIYSWNGTIQDFISLNKAQGFWEWKSVKIENADEAVVKGDRISDTSFTPMTYVFGLFKRNNHLVLFANTQNPGNYGGCVLSNTKQPFEQKFKFTQ